MIHELNWEDILTIWQNKLWPKRISAIEPNSAMNFLTGYSSYNMITKPTFFGYFVDGNLSGVNSGHMCDNMQYRSRGLYVDPKYRGHGIGVELLKATIGQAKLENADMIWSMPRKSSWNTYSRAGFELASEWFKTETSENNAYCVLKLKKYI